MKLTNFRKFLLVIAVLFITLLNAQNVGKIESLTNDELRFNYDVFIGSISSYENKLIVGNGTKTEEFIMLPNGELERTSFFDHSVYAGVIHGDRYYLPKSTTNERGVDVFDLTKTPMQLITFIDFRPIQVQGADVNTMFFSESYLMFYTWAGFKIDLFCIETYTYEGFIQNVPGGGGFWDYSDGVYIRISAENPNMRLTLFSLNENTNSLEEISSREITGYGTRWGKVSVIDKKIIMNTDGFSSNAILIINISNPANPYTVHRIPGRFYNFYYTESRIYAYNYDTSIGFQVYDLNAFDAYELVYTQPIHRNAASSAYGIHYVEPYLYLQAHFALLVFDTTQNFKMVNHYGTVNYFPITSICDNDVYYMEIDLFKGEQRIYSVIDNTSLVTLNLERMSLAHPWPAWMVLYNSFYIKDDRLYLLSQEDDNDYYFEIYEIENQIAKFLYRTYIDYTEISPYVNIHGNQIFLSSFNPRQVLVYDLIDDQISYKGAFPGRIPSQWSHDKYDFIPSIHNGTLYIRDISNFNRILLSRQIDYIDHESIVHYFDENHIILSRSENTDAPDRARMYYFDTNTDTLELLRSFTTNNLTSHNRVLAATSQNLNNNRAEFFTITDGQVVSIGNINYGDRMVYTSSTYFFPDRRKMVLWANGGIWTYDIRFEGDVSEYEEVAPIVRSELLGNFPNPFNPETTISFTVGNAFSRSENIDNAFIQSVSVHVSIDIYNIRGQRVKRLLDGFYERGSHTVVWDGRDDSGRELGSGVYFYRMVAGDVVDTRRMVLLK
ncbi:MAG: hypothetical protein FWG98_02095 [Candidatus Cloacimonetes bacterium]|nr:hypothetical protein [Candidatus Cloacimonadota bacterium]